MARGSGHGERGSTLVAVALAVPAALFALLTLATGGLVLGQHLSLGHAATSGAEYAAAGNHTCAQIVQHARSAAGAVPGTDTADVVVSVERVEGRSTASVCGSGKEQARPCRTGQDRILVTVGYRTPMLVPVPFARDQFDLRNDQLHRCASTP